MCFNRSLGGLGVTVVRGGEVNFVLQISDFILRRRGGRGFQISDLRFHIDGVGTEMS